MELLWFAYCMIGCYQHGTCRCASPSIVVWTRRFYSKLKHQFGGLAVEEYERFKSAEVDRLKTGVRRAKRHGYWEVSPVRRGE